MNKSYLQLTNRHFMGWLTRCREETVSDSKKLEIIMMGLADLAVALATDGTEESINTFYKERDAI